MPSIWAIDIAGVQSAHAHPSGVHNFLSEWFAESHAEHHEQKSYSLRGRIDDPEGKGMRVILGTTSDALADSIERIGPGKRITFGNSGRHIGTVIDSPTLLTRASWNDLARPRAVNQWRIWMSTPLAFRRNGVDQPWPAPFQVLAGMQRRWPRDSVPVDAGEIDLLARGVAVTDVEIRTTLCEWPPANAWGAEGMVEWTWLGLRGDATGPSSETFAIDSLLRLAEFCGVGGYPQHGMGSVRVDAFRVKPRNPRGEAVAVAHHAG
ncbi:CRISPR system precrRNA processing endoribonuclease RAMP protein Cas6 [Micropruina sp.]|uniref:CRISPR system precrRNA processing endoribonuclease RAMP protein Cas6 n=1 Tax=Micropruina sp. TaxID=2737536 RepID=UPI0039E5C601